MATVDSEPETPSADRLAGAPERTINSVRGSATHHGRPLVHIGHLPADIAERLAERARRGEDR
ncbi:hypothetical protein [Streptomyces sp. CBMA152]|uniref:hypothetical protein n=1 Tax=Streptomyces sp. CBMA152 TaxID=1896312 RepID=UPI00166089FF|nr:hypothetical protein [Streptomyces sp. CBMA152]MBD0747492.1 hypothetical protein [Streptomyces sp. CBMA152]